jgi:hypothetical protein
VKTITDKVAEQITTISPAVNESVVNFLVNKEVDKRSSAIIQGIDKYNGLKNDLRKVKPDQVLFAEDGKEVSSGYSKAKLEERKKLIEQIEKLEKALDQAIGGGDMSKLYDLVK